VVNKRDHLRCYQTDRGPLAGVTVLLRNQFGPFQADVRAPSSLCLPSTKQIVKKGTPPRPKGTFRLDHFQCYSIRPSGSFKTRSVTIRDQFGRRKLSVSKPFQLCAPVKKNKSRVKNPVQHLVCYRARPARKIVRRVGVHNQFGGEITNTKFLNQLCVPTLKVVRKL